MRHEMSPKYFDIFRFDPYVYDVAFFFPILSANLFIDFNIVSSENQK